MTEQAILRTETPEERELRRYLSDLNARKDTAGKLQAEIEERHRILGRFEAEYHALIGALYVELDTLSLSIDMYSWRIDQLTANPGASLTDIERQVREQFSTRRETVDEDRQTTEEFTQQNDQLKTRPELPREDAATARQIYRELARRCHPDLAATAAERDRRAPLMQRINAAFQAQDLGALRALQNETFTEDTTFEELSIGDRLVWAIREVSRLDGIIKELEVELRVIRRSETFTLWQMCQNDPDALTNLATQLRTQITAKQHLVTELIANYRTLTDSMFSCAP